MQKCTSCNPKDGRLSYYFFDRNLWGGVEAYMLVSEHSQGVMEQGTCLRDILCHAKSVHASLQGSFDALKSWVCQWYVCICVRCAQISVCGVCAHMLHTRELWLGRLFMSQYLRRRQLACQKLYVRTYHKGTPARVTITSVQWPLIQPQAAYMIAAWVRQVSLLLTSL